MLIQTGWGDAFWNTENYYESHPYVTQEAAAYLRDCRVKLVGIDSHNIDDTRTKSRPVHTTLLGAGILIVEHLCNLYLLPDDGFTFSAVPPKFKGVGTFPVRAMAKIQYSREVSQRSTKLHEECTDNEECTLCEHLCESFVKLCGFLGDRFASTNKGISQLLAYNNLHSLLRLSIQVLLKMKLLKKMILILVISGDRFNGCDISVYATSCFWQASFWYTKRAR